MPTEKDLYLALKKIYNEKAYVLLPHVRNTTGYSDLQTTADAICFGLWPSRGIEVEGFEIKCSRQDWLTEVRNPAKADAIAKMCDRWWLVVADGQIVKDDELPPTWGLYVLKGSALTIHKKAPVLTRLCLWWSSLIHYYAS